MAAREIERQFDVALGAIIVTIEDDLGVRSLHTIHVIAADGSEPDVAKIVQDRLAAADQRAVKVRAAFKKHGWQGS